MPIVSVSRHTGNIIEGDDGVVYAKFRLLMSEAQQHKVKVHIKTLSANLSDWATPGVDFEPLNRDFVFKPGKIQKVVKVAVNGDTFFEADETLGIEISNVRGAELTPERLDRNEYIDIVNDDLAQALNQSHESWEFL